MRHFQQNMLVSEDGKKTIIERVYNTGEVEYWSIMTVGFQNGPHQGNAQVPFRIEVLLPGEVCPIGPSDDLIETFRRTAFDLFDAAFEAAKPAAHASVKQSVEMRVRQENSRILLAGAVQHIPVH